MNSLQQNNNQTMNIFGDSNSYKEPNIRKAKFAIGSKRFYTLEFDQNIEMQELKTMIQKAAHLKKNTFSLFNEGTDYTGYSDETFDSLFPDQDLVLFTLELQKGEDFEDNELLLQINMPCPDHDYKFLLYYCFDCGKSICSECFTNGAHKGHKIQDKCFYLLPSKYLVEKMFENWSKRPYDDFQISVDLNEYKNNLNNVIFKQLFQLLKETKKKCNDLVDKYNFINQKSLSNIRDSVRDIKVSCIKALDEYKDLINIKDIVNNQEIFIDFDHTYKDMRNKQKEKFKENSQKFQELNKGVSILVENLINDVVQMIKDVLEKALDDKQYDEIAQKINLKLINPINKDDIWNQLSDKKIKIKRNKKFGRNTINDFNNANRFKKIAEGNEDEEIDYDKNNDQTNPPGRNTMALGNVNSINYFDNTNNNENNSNDNYITGNIQQVSNGKINNIIRSTNTINDINNNNYSVDSTLKKQSFINTNNEKNNKNISQLLNNSNTAINDFNKNRNLNPQNQVDNTNIIQEENSSQNNKAFEEPNNIFSLQNNNTNKNNNVFGSDENNNSNIFNGKPIQNIFGSILGDNKNNDNDNNNNNFFNIGSNQKSNFFSENIVSPICDNRTMVSNNGIFSNSSSFNCDLNNLNSAQQKKEGMNLNIDKNDKKLQNPFEFKTKNEKDQIALNLDKTEKNIVLSSPFSQINSNINKSNAETAHFNTINNNSTNSYQNSNINNNINDNINTPSQNKNQMMNIMDSKYLSGLANNCKTILEEANESESDLKTRKEVKKLNIEYYLKKPFILCPIPTTNKIKIITGEQTDENIITISFPQNFKISSFTYNCAYCNHKQKLYISGGVYNPGALEENSNKFYMIDLSKFKTDENNNNEICINSCIFELSPLIYNRSNHSMIAYNNEIYAVGGEGMNSVEKYDIENDEWTEISPMIMKRSNAMLAIANGFLYAFFGNGEDGKYPESIERINIQNDSFWEMILYSNPSNICTKIYGCGLYQIDELIYFLGGKCNEKKTDEIFYFNLNDRRIDYTNSKLAWKESFRENTLFDIGNKIIQIIDEKFFGLYLEINVE